jgi:hypothetical protein
VKYSPSERKGKPVAQEATLLHLLHEVQRTVFAIAHSYDIAGYPDRAWKLVGVGDCIRDAVMRLDDIGHDIVPRKPVTVSGLLLRAVLLRKQMGGPAWANSGAAPLVPRMTSQRPPRKKAVKRAHSGV